MKKYSLVLIAFLLFSSSIVKSSTKINDNSSVHWLTSFEEAQQMSKILNKPILVDFWADWCAPCTKMDLDVWSDEDVKVLLNNFIPVKLNIDEERSIATRYNVKSIPNVFILDSWGNELYKSIGYKDKVQVSKFLQSFSINLTSINQAMLILEKADSNIYSNIRVAQKFQDAGMVLEGAPKRAFIKSSNDFLKSAAKNGDKKDKDVYEKIELLKLLNKAYLNGYKSVLKTLDKNFKTIEVSNKALYYFLSYYCYTNLEMKGKAKDMFSKLSSEKGNTGYLKKIAFLQGV